LQPVAFGPENVAQPCGVEVQDQDAVVPSSLPKPLALRRAAQFIHTNASRPITLGEISNAASVTPRALQYGFRRHFGTTPMEYHRLSRLEGAHRELAQGNPGATVTAIAAKWGFLNPGRFSGFYKRIYGVNPSETLRRDLRPYSGA
jgi:transcriptional regulator GlxA family with amidase domain